MPKCTKCGFKYNMHSDKRLFDRFSNGEYTYNENECFHCNIEHYYPEIIEELKAKYNEDSFKITLPDDEGDRLLCLENWLIGKIGKKHYDDFKDVMGKVAEIALFICVTLLLFDLLVLSRLTW